MRSKTCSKETVDREMQTTDNSSSPKASRIPRLIEHLPSQESQPIVSDIVNVSVRIYFIAILKRNNNKKKTLIKILFCRPN